MVFSRRSELFVIYDNYLYGIGHILSLGCYKAMVYLKIIPNIEVDVIKDNKNPTDGLRCQQNNLIR